MPAMPDGPAGIGPADGIAAPASPAGQDWLHVVFGTGQVGGALAAHLARLGLPVRAVSRHQPHALDGGVERRPADVTDPEAAADAAKGASVIYQCLNAPYTQWPELFPPLQHGVLAAAEHTGALLVSPGDLVQPRSGRGPADAEDLPLAATTVKGGTRAAMTGELLAAAKAGRVRVAIGRASDFFGPGVTGGSMLGERVFGNALAGRRADFIGRPDLPHTDSYVPDIAAGLATLGTDPRAAGQVWHLPGPPTVTTRALLDLLAAEVGHQVPIRSVPKLAVRALGLINPTMRSLAEMAYEFEEPFTLAHSTILPAAVVGLGWWQGRPLVLAFGLVWLAHIGADWLLDYGLKYGDNFQHTHLGQLSRPGGTP
jgi:nucleoside-diphosphate-sugar epimerase